MKGFQIMIDGNWAHFKKPETNNNPLSHDIITKTALIGLIGAVLGIERNEMKELFPQLSEDLLYGVQLLNPVRKVSWGFTSKTAINPTAAGSPKYFEFLKNPKYKISIGLNNMRSEELFEAFKKCIDLEQSVYTPILGIHNCPANLTSVSEGIFSEVQNGLFETYGFVEAGIHQPKYFSGDFRVGFDRIPTYQDNDFWNLPDKYKNIIYPEATHALTVEGQYFDYITENKSEKWWMI